MSLIEKIDTVTNEHPYKVIGDTDSYSQYNEGWADACDRMLSVLSEQKETHKSCSNCGNNTEYLKPHTCDICTSLDQETEFEMWEPKPLTIGDKIRESNESLAKYVSKEQCPFECIASENCYTCADYLKKYVVNIAYLNQPYTE